MHHQFHVIFAGKHKTTSTKAHENFPHNYTNLCKLSELENCEKFLQLCHGGGFR